MRPPKLTSVTPAAIAACTSPRFPSAFRADQNHCARRNVAFQRREATSSSSPLAEGSTNISRCWPRAAASSSSKSIGSSTGGTTARPHCLTDEMTVRSHRSSPRPRAEGRPGNFGAAAHERLHGRHAEHDGVANDRVHLVALQQRLRERQRRRAGSGAAVRGSDRPNDHAAADRLPRLAPAPRVPARRKSRPSSPRPSRSTRDRCCASSSGRCTS